MLGEHYRCKFCSVFHTASGSSSSVLDMQHFLPWLSGFQLLTLLLVITLHLLLASMLFTANIIPVSYILDINILPIVQSQNLIVSSVSSIGSILFSQQRGILNSSNGYIRRAYASFSSIGRTLVRTITTPITVTMPAVRNTPLTPVCTVSALTPEAVEMP